MEGREANRLFSPFLCVCHPPYFTGNSFVEPSVILVQTKGLQNRELKKCADKRRQKRQMARLQGKASPTATYAILAVILIIAVFFGLEYMGVIDVIPNFGKVKGV